MLLLAGSAGAGAVVPESAAGLPDPRAMTFPPLGVIREPEIERRTLGNGLVVYLLEDHEFPLVDIQVLVHAGGLYEPQALRGLARLAGQVLRSGGTTSVPGDSLDVRLESMGASIETEIRPIEGRVTASFLSQNANEGLALLVDLMRHPAFPDEKLALAKVDARTEIASRNDDALAIAGREFGRLMYGADSPYGWFAEYATIEAITRDDLVGFHGAYFHPDRMIVTVYGDFERVAMLKELQRLLGDWPAVGEPLPPDPPVPAEGPQGVYYAPKEGVTQSIVFFGLIGTRASDPDYAPLQLIDQILGSGFTSRLVNEIRTQRGLAYAVGSGPGTGWHHPGIWMVYLMTQSDSTVVAARLAREAIARIAREPVSEEELETAREIVLNQLVFDLSSKEKILRRQAFYEFHGYPRDFLERYQQRVRTLTASDLLETAQRRIHADRIATVIVGLKEDFAHPIEDLGPVTELDIAIPPPASRLQIPPPTEAAMQRGRAILEAAAAAQGAEAIAGFRSIRLEGKGTLSMMGQAFPVTLAELRVPPDRRWSRMNIGGMAEIVTALEGAKGWVRMPQGTRDLAGEDLEDAAQDRTREPGYFLVHRAELSWQALEPKAIDGAACDAVYAREAPVEDWILYFDAATHLLLAMEYAGRGPQGPVHAKVYYGDYREVSGARMYYTQRALYDGQEFMKLDIDRIDVNVPVDEGLFRRPE
jgi:predicted Zn-dependent peptidase